MSANEVAGLHPAIVTDVHDGDHQGRVRVRPAWLDEADDGVWARVAMPMAGHGRGLWFMPEVGDEVVVGFNNGDPAHPYVVGALWNGVDRPPVPPEAAGRLDVIRTAGGSVIEFDNDEDGGAITIATEAGQKISLESQSGSITIDSGNGAVVTVGPAGVEIAAASMVRVSAPAVSVDAGIAKFSGVVQVETLIATAVVAASYSPGVGNVW